tara:strand:+ start:727 stop:1065 length:339 start_codon:yes stop_codon:yes gene_type:complete
MIYSFRQNNSGGYYTHPAKHVIVKDARDSDHATEIALAAGVYFNGTASGSDCPCCGDRWYGVDAEHDTLDEALGYIGAINTHSSQMQRDSDGRMVPLYVVVDDLDVEDTVLE